MCWNRRPPVSAAPPEAATEAALDGGHAHPRADSVTAAIAKKARRSKCKVAECGRRLRSKYEFRCGLCVQHLRSLELLRDGVPSRFCQKCQKFQPVAEFEGDRKSCIEGLLRHNEKQRAARAARDAAAADAPADETPPRRPPRSKTSPSSLYISCSGHAEAALGLAVASLQPMLAAPWAPLLSPPPLRCTDGADRGSFHSAQSLAGAEVPSAAPSAGTGAPAPAPLELDEFIRELMREPGCYTSLWCSTAHLASVPPVLALPAV